MKLNNSRNSKYDLAELRKMHAGPDRLLKLLTLLDQDIAQYPLDANPPDAVTAAHAEYISATSVARQTVEGVETAKEAAGTAAGADLSDAMQAIQAGKITPKSTTQAKAADAIAAAVTFTTAAENLVEEAHDKLVDAVQKVWPEWRPQMIRDAAAARVKAAEATAAAAVAVATGRTLFATVTTLDHQVLSRDPKLAAAAYAEMRQGLPWYESTHFGGAPLTHVILPGVDKRAKPVRLDLAVVVDAVAAAVAEAGTWPAVDWTPLTDPAHAALLAEPLDPATPWVLARAMRETGGTCSVCLLAPAAEAVVIKGQWWSVCAACAAANAADQDKILDKREREAKAAEHGVDPNAFYSVGEDGSHHPA